MKDKYYQQVMCKDELPKEKGWYGSDLGKVYFLPHMADFSEPCVWWLKPIDPIELAWDECAKTYDQHNIDWCLWNIKNREGDAK
jgi:hypothetical protein